MFSKHLLILSCFVLIILLFKQVSTRNITQKSSQIRIDCHPDRPVSTQKCADRGCTWMPSSNPLEPACFFPEGYGYRNGTSERTKNSLRFDLHREPKHTIYGKEIDLLNFVAYKETSKRLRLKFEDKLQKRYEVPLEQTGPPSPPPQDTDYEVDFTNNPQFGVNVKRVSTGTVIFDTNVPGMVFSDQYIQITTKLSSSNIYGLGEHYNEDYRHDTNWKSMSFFARDQSPIDPQQNIYGVHPFYISVENDGNAHGIFLLNSNAMEVVIQPYPAITFRTIGGILDFYIFLGPTPEEVVQQYLEVIGLPMMPPYWALGFQLSRWGYNNIENLTRISTGMLKNGIPYDVQYLDIDYMDGRKDFTIDNENFDGLREFVDRLHSEHDIKLVPILDPAIANDPSLNGNYPPLDLGKHLDVFIKVGETILNGSCWPGNVYYPDFSHPNAPHYWTQLCQNFHQVLPFDGLWIDMNEPSNFVEGSQTGCASTSLNYPPYSTGVLGSDKNNMIFAKTICMDADQHAGKHYDVHSLYGTFEANVTHKALLQVLPEKRPMIVSRSTYPGAGRYSTHWLGDNFSTWLQMQTSIIGILEFNLFGFPFVGPDICGFNSNTTEDLCYRWMQLGAFYPFSRSHNTIGAKSQDPPSLGERVIKASRTSLSTRYELLPYLYTLFHFAHTTGSTVARPLLHEFPKDSNTLAIKYQFLWGPALMISPILFQGAESVNAYFPEGYWYDFYSGVMEKQGAGVTINLKDSGKINLHVRGGHILPLQKPDVTTTKSRKNPMGLFIAPNESGQAEGVLFLDDGVSYETQKTGKYTFIEVIFKKVNNEDTELSSEIQLNNYAEAGNLIFGYMTICNQPTPTNVFLNGQPLEGSKWQYSETVKVLELKQLQIPVTEAFKLKITH